MFQESTATVGMPNASLELCTRANLNVIAPRNYGTSDIPNSVGKGGHEKNNNASNVEAKEQIVSKDDFILTPTKVNNN